MNRMSLDSVGQGSLLIYRRFRHIPDLIKGDLDSLRDDVREFYEGRVGQTHFHSQQKMTDAI